MKQQTTRMSDGMCQKLPTAPNRYKFPTQNSIKLSKSHLKKKGHRTEVIDLQWDYKEARERERKKGAKTEGIRVERLIPKATSLHHDGGEQMRKYLIYSGPCAA